MGKCLIRYNKEECGTQRKTVWQSKVIIKVIKFTYIKLSWRPLHVLYKRTG